MSGMKDAFDNYMDMILSSGVNETSESIDDLSDFNDVDQDLDTYRNIFTSKGSFSGVDEEEQYSWREDYDYNFDHNIDPDDYETEEEYLEALEEAEIDSASVLRYSHASINSPYKVGQTILHDSFGIGDIVAVNIVGNELLLDINFQNIGIKKIFTRYARLTTNPIEIEKVKQKNNVFFEDENIRISFVKWERNCHLVGGYARAGTFIFENKSNKRIYITMKEVSVGGFLNRDEVPPTILSAGQKEMKSFPFVYENKVPEQEKDNKSVEFKVYYGELRDGYSSKANIIDPVVESDIISIPLCFF